MMDNLDFDEDITNYGVHTIYSYPARFVPQIPRYFIEKYNPNAVCDCFGGSGTTAVEGKVAGCHTIHMDIMPVSFMLARVKTREFSTIEFHRGFREMNEWLEHPVLGDLPVKMQREISRNDDREHFFSVPVQQQIQAIRTMIKEINCNDYTKDFMRLCAAQCLRRCSYAKVGEIDWVRAKEPACNENFIAAFRQKCESTRSNFVEFYQKHPGFLNRKYPTIIDTKKEWLHEKFDLLVTSPPYGSLNVVNYPGIHEFTHALFSNKPSPAPGHFVQKTPQLNVYFSKVIPYLNKGGHAIVVVAPSKDDNWANDTIDIMRNLGLKLHDKGQRVIKATKKYVARGIKTEWVLDFVK
jgi:hypothetical protein